MNDMKYCGSLYVVDDANRTKEFYKEIFGLRVIQDFGANFVMTGGISFQTKESWKEFIHKDSGEIVYGGNDAEIYFEAEDLDEFLKKIENKNDIVYVHPLITHDWGQRGIRFYDPDLHIIEVSEKLSATIQRLYKEGMRVEDISQKTMLSVKMVERFMKK